MKNKQIEENKECVQCCKEMVNSYGNEFWCAPFCENQKCPNFGLLQTGIMEKTNMNEQKYPKGLKKCKCCGFSHATDSMNNEALEAMKWLRRAAIKSSTRSGGADDYISGIRKCIKLLDNNRN